MSFEYAYPLPAVTVDTVIFTLRKSKLWALLVRRADAPYQDCWALPGGFVEVGVGYSSNGDQGESLLDGAARELQEETGLAWQRDRVFLEQLFTFGDPNRDPRGRVISVAYYALIPPEAYHRVHAGSDAQDARWFEVESLPSQMAFDHETILTMALERIRGKIDYDPRIARALLPAEFTVSQLRRVYEIVKGTNYDLSNFRKRFHRMVEDGRFIELNETQDPTGRGRPGRLYSFAE